MKICLSRQNRRGFLGGIGAVLCLASLGVAAEPGLPPVFRPGARVLFQGDSITDGNRGRSADPNHILGHGYAFIIAARYGAAYPESGLTFLNRGVSGNKVTDLVARWPKETLELAPDVLSILIGINDAAAGVSVADFERDYDQLLTETRAARPGIRLVLGEPFHLPVGSRKNGWEAAEADLKRRREVVARLAKKHGAALALFQQAFDAAARRAAPDYWIWDGIHPTYSGHQIMADEWVRAVKEFWPER